MYRDGAFVRELRLVPRVCYDQCQAPGSNCADITLEEVGISHDGSYNDLRGTGGNETCGFADGTGYSSDI